MCFFNEEQGYKTVMLFRFLILVHVIVAFPLKCPEPAQWSVRARSHCPDPTKYFCLKNDLINGYSENCTIFDFLQPGRKNVLRGGLDADICSSERYQPWPIKFYTNVSTTCIFLKSKCNDEGQVVSDSGNRNIDISCRCDYTRGYNFIIQPRNSCFCLPSTEDCSCYLKTCQDSRNVLSSDYECIHSNKNTSINQCKPIINGRLDKEANQTDTKDIVRRRNISIQGKYRSAAAILVTIFLPVVIFLSFPLAIVITHCSVQHNYFSKSFTLNPIEPTEGTDIFISCEIKEKDKIAIWYKNGIPVSSTDKINYGVNGRKHNLKIVKAERSDSGEYCISIEGVKQQMHVHVEDYFSKALTIDSAEPTEGNDLSISCEIKQRDIIAIWYKNGCRVSSTDKMKYDVNERKHTLKIVNAELSDSGEYCIEVGGVKRQIHLEVEDYFSKALTIDPAEPKEGNDISISCEIKQRDIIAIWYKNGCRVSSTDKMKYNVNERKHTLKIVNAELSYSGEYCIEVGGVKRKIHLEVEDSFLNALTIDPAEPHEGNDISISCEIKQRDIIAIWYKNGSRVSSTDKMKYDVNERKHTLKIHKAKLGDSGEYCIDVGGVKRQIHLTVEENQLDSSERKQLLDAIKNEKEVRQYVRVHVIGKDSVGKSCLVRRLLEEGIENVTSTDGIDIIKRCQIRTSDGEWIVHEGETERMERIKRIQQAIDQKHKPKMSMKEKPSQSKQYSVETRSPHKSKEQESSKGTSGRIDNDETNNAETIIGAFKDKSIENALIIADTVDRDKIAQNISSEQMPLLNAPPPIICEIHKVNLEETFDEILLEVTNMNKVKESECLVECGLWDFAGQKDYYVTHQIFLTPNAIYLLVANLKEDIKDRTYDGNFDEIGEYIDFWFDSIHCFCKDHSTEKLVPPVITVFTHTDECEKVEERKKTCIEKIKQTVGHQRKGDHNRSIQFISNKEGFEKGITNLKREISGIAAEMKYFAEELPTAWIQLENAFAVLKDLNEIILPWKDIEELARKTSINEKEQLLHFLTYQHKIGNIIFFKDISDYIILQPNWLVKCFRCLVCDSSQSLLSMSEWTKLTDTGELSDDIIDKLFKKEPVLQLGKYKNHLLHVMEKFDIVIKPKFEGTKSDECQKSNSYFMPCMIDKNPTPLNSIMENFVKAKTSEGFSASPWLILEFEFLPLAYFNHVLFHYIRLYTVCEDKNEQKALYGGKAVFYLDKTKCRKLVVIFSKNSISLQIWKWRDVEDNTYRHILLDLCYEIEKLKRKLSQKISYEIKAKCWNGDYSNRSDRISYEKLTEICEEGTYFCEEHKENHRRDDIENTWLKHVDTVKQIIDALKMITEQNELITRNIIGNSLTRDLEACNIEPDLIVRKILNFWKTNENTLTLCVTENEKINEVFGKLQCLLSNRQTKQNIKEYDATSFSLTKTSTPLDDHKPEFDDVKHHGQISAECNKLRRSIKFPEIKIKTLGGSLKYVKEHHNPIDADGNISMKESHDSNLDTKEKRMTDNAKTENDSDDLCTTKGASSSVSIKDIHRMRMTEKAWQELCTIEIKRGERLSLAELPQVYAPDTILLLDLSGSMKGTAFTDMKAAVHDFLDKRITTREELNLNENIAMVIFGYKTEVKHHLTSDYNIVRLCLDTLPEPGGPSPLIPGLKLCQAVVAARGTISIIRGRKNGSRFHPKIVLLSDGNFTPSECVIGNKYLEDLTTTNEEEETKMISDLYNVCRELQQQKIQIVCIPVGCIKETRLTFIAETTNGKVLNIDKMATLGNERMKMVLAKELQSGSSSEDELKSKLLSLNSISANDYDDIKDMSENPEKYGIINEDNSDEADEETVVHLNMANILAIMAAALGLPDIENEDESPL